MKLDFPYAIGVILLLAGWLFAFLPHAEHGRVGFTEQSHEAHVALGVFLVVCGVLVLWKFQHKK